MTLPAREFLAKAKFVALAICWTFLAFGSDLHAASLERTSDGDLVLTLFGERLHFRERDAGNVVVTIPSYSYTLNRKTDPVCEPSSRWWLIKGTSLRDWLDSESLGKCLSSALSKVELHDPTIADPNVWVWVTPVLENGFVYPGAIPEQTLEFPDKEVSHALSLYIVIDGLPRQEPREYTPILSEAQEGKNNWWIRTPSNSFSKTRKFFLPPQFRAGSTLIYFSVMCGYEGDDGKGGIICNGDFVADRVYFRYTWLEGRDNEGHEILPRPSWEGYDEAVRTMANSIFADHPSGFLQ